MSINITRKEFEAMKAAIANTSYEELAILYQRDVDDLNKSNPDRSMDDVAVLIEAAELILAHK